MLMLLCMHMTSVLFLVPVGNFTLTVATGHALEKLHLLICACVICDLEVIKKNKSRFLLYLMQPGMRNNEFTYHSLRIAKVV